MIWPDSVSPDDHHDNENNLSVLNIDILKPVTFYFALLWMYSLVFLVYNVEE